MQSYHKKQWGRSQNPGVKKATHFVVHQNSFPNNFQAILPHIIGTQIPNPILYVGKDACPHFNAAKTTKYSYFGENTRFPYISVQNQCKFCPWQFQLKIKLINESSS